MHTEPENEASEAPPAGDGAQEARRRTRRRNAFDRILDAAVELLLDRGIQGTNMDAIASRAQSSKQTIYTHFEDKNTILRHALDRVTRQLATVTVAIDTSTSDMEAELERLALVYLTHLADERSIRALRLCVEITRTIQGTATHLPRQRFAGLHGQINAFMQAMIDQGRMRCEDPDAATSTLMSLASGDIEMRSLICASFAPDAEELRRRARDATRFFCRAVRADD